MLTREMLQQNALLATLSEERLAAIAEMSRNDENTVIGAKIGALHGQYDTDIFSITGIKKNDGEKSYDYAKRILNEYKTKAESTASLQGKLTAANNKIAELNQKIANGEGDEALRQQLKDTKNQVTQLQSQLSESAANFVKEKAALEDKLKNTHVDYAFEMAVSGLKFKAGIPESIHKVLLASAKNEVLSKGTPDFIEDGQGGQKLVLRDANGAILNNPSNNLNPYTLKELVLQSSLKDVIDLGRQQTGSGTKPLTDSSSSGNGTLDFSGVKTQVDANKVIEKHLLAEGLTRDSKEFAEKSLELYNENKVSELPLR